MKYKRVQDRKMKDAGEINFEKRKIRVNPAKGDLLNTIIHEELHRRFPDKPEKWINKQAKKKEKELTVAKAIKLLHKYHNRTK